MARRKSELFSLSFLDLLTSALGAIIFLFIITPKGGESAAAVRQAVVYFDTTQMKIFGDLDDSLLYKEIGDTLFTVLVDYKKMPEEQKAPKPTFASIERPREPKPTPSAPTPEPKKVEKPSAPKVEAPKKEEPKPTPAKPAPNIEKPKTGDKEKVPDFKGDAPSVPCKVSMEINWRSAQDNVDLIVCKGSDCVNGGRKRDKSIGQWDSGKSRNRLFGNDLRTNQEAVRQFDNIIPGEYKLYARFKESDRGKKSVLVSGLIYTKDVTGQQRGESFSKTLKIGNQKVLLGTLKLQRDGKYQFIKAR